MTCIEMDDLKDTTNPPQYSDQSGLIDQSLSPVLLLEVWHNKA